MGLTRKQFALWVAGLAALQGVFAGFALADSQIMLMGIPATRARVTQTWVFQGCTTLPGLRRKTDFIGAGTNFPTYPYFILVSAQNQGQQPLTGDPGVTGFVTGTPKNTCQGSDLYAQFQGEGYASDLGGGLSSIFVRATCQGGVDGGGALGTLAVGDTSMAKDSLRASVGVLNSTTVRINNFLGHIRNRLGTGSNQTVRNTLILAVYPDTNAADADVGHTGVGASFFGRIVLTHGQIHAIGGFGAADFALTTGTLTDVATPAPGLSKDVTVPNAAAAAVVLIGDPRVGGPTTPNGPPVPGASPVALVLMSLAMLGGGVWFITTRRRVAGT
jgi:hypothetical protein